MDRNEIISFIKENLKITVSGKTEQDIDYYGNSIGYDLFLNVSLIDKITGEEIIRGHN